MKRTIKALLLTSAGMIVKIWLAAIFLLSLLLPTQAQTVTREVVFTTSNPTTCASTRIYINRTNQTIWARSLGGACEQIGGGAPTNATYVTQTANGSLSAEQALSALSSGIMRVAATTGVVTSLTDSAGIAANVSDETGSGALAFGTQPSLTSARVITDISDTNGNELLKVTATGSAINEFTVANAAAGGGPALSATGGDTNINLNLIPKGTGQVVFGGEVNGPVSTDLFGGSTTTTAGYFRVKDYVIGIGTAGNNKMLFEFAAQDKVVMMNAALFGWSSTGQETASNLRAGLDTALARNAVNVLEVNNGTAGGLGKLLAARVVTAKTSGYTVLSADKSTFFTNTGAVAGVTFTLPTPVVGMTYEFYRDANQTVTIDVATGVTIRIGASVTTDGGNVTLDAVGSRIRVVAISTTQWVGDLSGTATFN